MSKLSLLTGGKAITRPVHSCGHAATQSHSKLSKARQRLIEVQTRIWQVELVDPGLPQIANPQPGSERWGKISESTCSYLWLLAERDQDRCHNILAEEGRHF